MKKIKWFIIFGVLLFILGNFSGIHFFCKEPDIENHSDTIKVYQIDTIEIPNDVYHYSEVIIRDTLIDTIIVPANVDTSAILIDYFSRNIYHREWRDSSLYASIWDTTFMNRIYSGKFEYRILRPQTTIINKTEVNNYSTYLGIGLDTDFEVKNPNINLTFTSKNYGLKLLYYPKQESFGFGASYNIIRLK